MQRVKIYQLIQDGTLEGFKVGADWKVKTDSVEKIIGEIPTEFFND